jgi:hypothetical protein
VIPVRRIAGRQDALDDQQRGDDAGDEGVGFEQGDTPEDEQPEPDREPDST